MRFPATPSTSRGEQSSWSGMPHFLPPDIISGTQEAHSGSSANSAGSTLFSVSFFTGSDYTKSPPTPETTEEDGEERTGTRTRD